MILFFKKSAILTLFFKSEMKISLLESFKQNPKALERLLATGNSELTHIQDKGKCSILSVLAY